MASLNNWAFRDGYAIRRHAASPTASWREIFNSDADAYGGSGLPNGGPVASSGGVITVNIPANSVLVLQRQ